MQNFKPTHNMTFHEGSFEVMLDISESVDEESGPLYRQEEWDTYSTPDYSYDNNRNMLLFQGQPYAGSWELSTL